MTKAKKRVAIYLRISTRDGRQTVESQKLELEAIAERSGWEIVATFSDEASGTKGRDKRPGLDDLLKAATQRKFDMIAAWSVDRLGRSLTHLLHLFEEFKSIGVGIYLQQQAVDSNTPSGRAMLQMSGVFAEFEREMTLERIHTGLDRARAQGKHLGRKRTLGATDHAIIKLREQGMGMVAIAKKIRCGTGRVQAVVKGVAA